MSEQTIRHQVIFDLRWDSADERATKFLEDGRRILTAIPGVENFAVFRQISPKNDYTYAFTMEFGGPGAYQAYMDHPDHRAFVKERWTTEVTRFLEIDLEDLAPQR